MKKKLALVLSLVLCCAMLSGCTTLTALMGKQMANAATDETSGDTVTIAGAPTTLTASGVGIFQNNYPAGTALEPLTVTIGAPAAAPAGATGTVASAPAPAFSASRRRPVASTSARRLGCRSRKRAKSAAESLSSAE